MGDYLKNLENKAMDYISDFEKKITERAKEKIDDSMRKFEREHPQLNKATNFVLRKTILQDRVNGHQTNETSRQTSSETYVVFDIETTGFSHRLDSITQIAAMKFCGNQKIAEFNSLLNTSFCSYKVQKLTGITLEMLRTAPSRQDVLRNFRDFVSNTDILVGHNIQRFDIPFINSEFSRFNISPLYNRFVDTLLISFNNQDKIRSQSSKLVDLARALGISVDENKQHNALYDVHVTYQCFTKFQDMRLVSAPDTFHSNSYSGTNQVKKCEVCGVSDISHQTTSCDSCLRKEYQEKLTKQADRQLENLQLLQDFRFENISDSSELVGAEVVITGECEDFSREQLFGLLERAGANPHNGVTLNTNILVVCDDDYVSSKMVKAFEYQKRGMM